jgi:hypothetical protein
LSANGTSTSTANALSDLTYNPVTYELGVTGSVLLTGLVGTTELQTTVVLNSMGAGVNPILTIDSTIYRSGFVEYALFDNAGNARSGSIWCIVESGSIQFTEVSTLDIGSTAPVILNFTLAGPIITLEASIAPGPSAWNISTILRAI